MCLATAASLTARIRAASLAVTLLVVPAAQAAAPSSSPNPVHRGAGTVPVAPSDTQPLPRANGVRARNIDVKHVALDLRFDWAKRQAWGTATITLAPLTETDHVALDAAKLTISTVSSRGGTKLPFTCDGSDANDNLHITLDRTYRAGEDATVVIGYRTNWVNTSDPNNLWGSYGKGIRFFGPTSTEPKKRRQIWSMGEPAGNRYWFPGYDAPNDLRTTEFAATVDKPLTAVSNGTLVATTNNPDGTRTFRWKMDTPYANHLTSFVIGEYTDVVQTHDGTPLHSVGYPDERDAVAASVVRLPDMVRFFSQATGVRYPYASYTQVFVQDFAGGMANTTMSTITDNMIDDARTHADYFYLWDAQEAHVLASQWFGNYVTPREWGHAWLKESFAHYFDAMYSEHKNGHDEFLLSNRLFDQGAYLADWNGGNRRPVVTHRYDSAEVVTRDNYSSGRGAQVLHMLRKHLGEDNWKKAIRHYLLSNANHLVSTDDFRIAVEEATGEPMQWFFDQWLYSIGHPVFVVTTRYDNVKRQTILNVRQTQRADTSSHYPQVQYFQGKVDLAIDGRITQVWLEPKAENIYTLPASAPPRLVSFDHESTWIKEITFTKSLDELLWQVQHDTDVLGRLWAMGELMKLASADGTPAADRAQIQASFRAVVLSDSYWRLRNTALSQLRTLLAPATETRPVALDSATIAMLQTVIQHERAWYRASAIAFLGMTRDPRYAGVYLEAMQEDSHPVINAAAVALGKSRSPRAFGALVRLMEVPSWKGENRISGLNGLKELGDPRGVPLAFKALSDLISPHWMLATATWDHRLAGAETIVTLGKSAAAYPILLEQFRKSMGDGDYNDIFINAQFITTLGDPRGQEVFDLLRARFKDDAYAMTAVLNYEAQWKEATKKR